MVKHEAVVKGTGKRAEVWEPGGTKVRVLRVKQGQARAPLPSALIWVPKESQVGTEEPLGERGYLANATAQRSLPGKRLPSAHRSWGQRAPAIVET